MSSSGHNSTTSSPARRKPKKLEVRGSRLSVDLKHSKMDSPKHGRVDSDELARQTFERKDSELPSLPVDENSYLRGTPSFTHRSDEPNEGLMNSDSSQTLDEWAMRRHLMEDESSFLPETAAVPVQDANAGADDTYLELGKHEKNRQSSASRAPSSRPGSGYKQLRTSMSGRQLDTPTSQRSKVSSTAELGEQAESLTASMSPAEAAAQRSHTRNERSFNTNSQQSMLESIRSSPPGTPNGSRSSTPENKAEVQMSPSSVGTLTVRENLSPRSKREETTSGSPPNTPRRLRPSFFDSQHVSQQSSQSTATVSSVMSGSDTVGLDYALQTGGARPESGSMNASTRASNGMNRLPSMASEMSFMTRDSQTLPTLGRLAAAGATPFGRDRLSTRFEENEPTTPRPNTSGHDAPTDTVLARRVESIQVPETVARDFRARNPSLMPERRPASSDGAPAASGTGPRRTLTLKEQNGKIDKLSKENFDLKLKIHFLDSALRNHSDEGLQELIDKNVQCQTDLANERKESQALRRRMRELERKVKELEESLAEAQRSKPSRDRDSDDEDPTLQAEMHEEILYLRQQLDHSENEVTTLKEEILTEKLDKRKMAEHMRSMAGNRADDSSGVRETMEMWQDLLDAETGRREQAEEELRKLREDMTAMRIERAAPAVNHSDRRGSRFGKLGYGQGGDNESDYINGVNGSESSHSMVEQLKSECAELRRDLGAQTSMLTSRNRERERLQQEIEDLKMLQRKSDGARSVAGESIFERSISRAHNRAPSRVSEHAQVTEAERDDWEKKEGQLRDQNAEMKLKYQELERTHNTHMQYVSALEGDFQDMETELGESNEDLKALAAERDEALQGAEELQSEYDKLEQEAMSEIDRLEKEVQRLSVQLQEALKRVQKTSTKLEHATDGYKGLQGELRDITQSVMNLEDEKQANVRSIETLQQQLAEAEEELQRWEEKCKEFADKNRKLEVTQESLHSEITFLREEQEGDKIKIGELEDALNAAQQSIQDEQEKMRDLEDEILQERQQRDVLEDQSKEEVQKVLDDLNSESARTKDELRKLRRSLSAKEVEASAWRQKLDELEQSLRQTLGDQNGTKQTMLSVIAKMQRDLEQTATQLDRTKMDLADKDRLLRHRDGLLESTSLESRRLSDLLDKERSARKHDLEQFEKDSRGKASHMRTIAQHESRVLELETAYSQDKRKMSALETRYKEQLSERNTLLLALWHRLSTMCGQDWSSQHALVDGETVSAEVISRSMPGFNKNIILAVKQLESLLGDFKIRIRSTEKDLRKDYQTLEHNLDLRIRRMDVLERAVQDTQARLADEATIAAINAAQNRPQAKLAKGSFKGINSDEAVRLRSEIKLLKAELKFHRQHPSAMAQQLLNAHQHAQAGLGSDPAVTRPSTNATNSSMNTGAARHSTSSPARTIMSQLLRHHSTSAVETLPPSREGSENSAPPVAPLRTQNNILIPSQPIQPSEQRWIHRLKEMERRLKAEREARLLDRRGARQRLEEGRLENEELRYRLEEAQGVRDEGSEGVEEGDEQVYDEGRDESREDTSGVEGSEV